MGLYTKIFKQVDNFYEVNSIDKSLSKQTFYLKFLVLLLSVFNVFMIIKMLFLYSSHCE